MRCLPEPEFVLAANYGGIREVRIWSTPNEANVVEYIVSVKIKKTDDIFYLATRRKPSEARRFKAVDVAIAALNRVLKISEFIVCQ
jgi:hypothetical protein